MNSQREIVVIDPPPQPLLVEKASGAGMEPKEYVVSLMKTHGTYAASANAAGVHVLTLRRWIDRLGLIFERAS